MTATTMTTAIDLPTAEYIAALFREHDVLPRQTVYLALPGELVTRPAKCSACAVGILLVERRGSVSEALSHCTRSCLSMGDALRAEIDLPLAFLNGLDYGFTNSNDDETWEEFLEEWGVDDLLYIKGFRVGWQAWELANAGAGLPEEARP
jgi:hypothetical protein